MAARSSKISDLDNPYERERQQRIAGNQQRLDAMGVLKQSRLLESYFPAVRNSKSSVRPPKVKGVPPTRQSPRLQTAHSDVQSTPHSQGESKQQQVIVADANAAWLLKRERRCDQKGRGSIFDSTAGITCHFCRQKKLCGEEGCPRCNERNVEQQCIGKSECSRCEAASGRFCRACLLVRYGLELEDVRHQMAAGAWLCPHCYEEEHPEEGWICNSSICMTRRGMKPTGIAIFEAQQKGFASVAHFVQAQIVSRASTRADTSQCSKSAAGGAEQPACSTDAAQVNKDGDIAACKGSNQSMRSNGAECCSSSCSSDDSKRVDGRSTTAQPSCAGTEAAGTAAASSPECDEQEQGTSPCVSAQVAGSQQHCGLAHVADDSGQLQHAVQAADVSLTASPKSRSTKTTADMVEDCCYKQGLADLRSTLAYRPGKAGSKVKLQSSPSVGAPSTRQTRSQHRQEMLCSESVSRK